MKKRERREFTEEFKHQMVQLRKNGKPRAEILREYDLTATAFDRWCRQSERSGSFKEKDNRTPEENELIQLRKEITQLKMENELFKQAALILGRK